MFSRVSQLDFTSHVFLGDLFLPYRIYVEGYSATFFTVTTKINYITVCDFFPLSPASSNPFVSHCVFHHLPCCELQCNTLDQGPQCSFSGGEGREGRRAPSDLLLRDKILALYTQREVRKKSLTYFNVCIGLYPKGNNRISMQRCICTNRHCSFKNGKPL